MEVVEFYGRIDLFQEGNMVSTLRRLFSALLSPFRVAMHRRSRCELIRRAHSRPLGTVISTFGPLSYIRNVKTASRDVFRVAHPVLMPNGRASPGFYYVEVRINEIFCWARCTEYEYHHWGSGELLDVTYVQFGGQTVAVKAKLFKNTH